MSSSNIRVLVGDLFESDAQTLVNTVNCVGIMGKGIALGFRERYPEMFRDYAARCRRHEVQLGKPYLWAPLLGRWILNFPTKDHWRSLAKREDIVAGLEHLEHNFRAWGIESLAVPPLGCGEGKLEWSIVGPTLYEHLDRLRIPVELYAPHGTPPEELDRDFLVHAAEGGPDRPAVPLKLRPGAVALAAIVRRIDRQPAAWPVGRTRFQKLAYFATQAGIPTGLDYARGPYGPFAQDLSKLQSQLENNGVLVEHPGQSFFLLRPGPGYRNAVLAYRPFLEDHADAIERVANLMLRLTTHQAEVAATVHFAAVALARAKGSQPSEIEVLDYVRDWKHDRLKDDELAAAIRSLATLGWLEIVPSPDMIPDEFVLA
jgi:uncharacterized protein YwgA/O-acetyl-ADP-ribose deacetylase (regulator of RNase III)